MLVTEKSDFSCTEDVTHDIPKFDFGLFSEDILSTYRFGKLNYTYASLS